MVFVNASAHSTCFNEILCYTTHVIFVTPVLRLIIRTNGTKRFMFTLVTLPHLVGDTRLLFVTRFIRLFAYGLLSVVLVFYLVGLGLTEQQAGLLITATLVGDTIISLAITTRADRVGRRRMLILGALLMTAAGLVFASTANLWVLLLAGTIGVLSPSGHEVGPFLPIEQAALAHVVSDRERTEVFAWYTLTGSLGTALGALSAGVITRISQEAAESPVSSYRAVVMLYAALGIVLAAVFAGLSRRTEAAAVGETRSAATMLSGLSGLERSRAVVIKLSALFALDSFAGGFVVQAFAAYWFHLRFGVDAVALGAIFFWANIFAGVSALLASRLAARIGLIRTMVFTHLPSNVLLMLVPLMPSLPWAVAVLLLRFSISQMDVPARQSYVMAVVTPEERAAAGGLTGVARTIGASISPFFVGLMFARPALWNLPFFIAGTLKIVYDIMLYRQFVGNHSRQEARESPTVPTPGATRRSDM
jgi:MFS family permease